MRSLQVAERRDQWGGRLLGRLVGQDGHLALTGGNGAGRICRTL